MQRWIHRVALAYATRICMEQPLAALALFAPSAETPPLIGGIARSSLTRCHDPNDRCGKRREPPRMRGDSCLILQRLDQIRAFAKLNKLISQDAQTCHNRIGSNSKYLEAL